MVRVRWSLVFLFSSFDAFALALAGSGRSSDSTELGCFVYNQTRVGQFCNLNKSTNYKAANHGPLPRRLYRFFPNISNANWLIDTGQTRY
jgi:hypothetical protein